MHLMLVSHWVCLMLQAEMLVVLRIEEVLPRPAAGLLAKMLRLAPVDTIAVLGCAHPVLVLRPKTQYQISVAVFQVRNLLCS